MGRGQISFDFILAMVVALVFIGGIQLLGNELQAGQRNAAIKAQERAIALELAEVLNSKAMLKDSSQARVSYEVPKLLVPNESVLQGCEIRIGENEIKVYYPTMANSEVMETVKVKLERGTSIDANCGETLEA